MLQLNNIYAAKNTKSKKRPYGDRPLSKKNTGTKAQVVLQNTEGAFMHQYNKAGVNTAK